MDFKNMIKMSFFKCLHTNRYMKHEKNYIRFNLQTLFDKKKKQQQNTLAVNLPCSGVIIRKPNTTLNELNTVRQFVSISVPGLCHSHF